MVDVNAVLPFSFYRRSDVVQISKELLGKFLVTEIDGRRTAGMIVETEAYAGITDRASHAYNGRHSNRTAVMYRAGGVAYVYLIYGMYHLFNIVTNAEGVPDAVLIRAVEPAEGVEIMLKRRKIKKIDYKLTAGPGRLTRALGITVAHTGVPLNEAPIWLEDRRVAVRDDDITAGPRIGVDYAGSHAELPWRFWIRGNPWVSKK